MPRASCLVPPHLWGKQRTWLTQTSQSLLFLLPHTVRIFNNIGKACLIQLERNTTKTKSCSKRGDKWRYTYGLARRQYYIWMVLVEDQQGWQREKHKLTGGELYCRKYTYRFTQGESQKGIQPYTRADQQACIQMKDLVSVVSATSYCRGCWKNSHCVRQRRTHLRSR